MQRLQPAILIALATIAMATSACHKAEDVSRTTPSGQVNGSSMDSAATQKSGTTSHDMSTSSSGTGSTGSSTSGSAGTSAAAGGSTSPSAQSSEMSKSDSNAASKADPDTTVGKGPGDASGEMKK